MKALKILGIIFLVLVALFFIVALFLPSSAKMEASIVINKPASLVYHQVNSFKNWEPWSPFQANDTQMVVTYEGPESGVGNKMKWTSKQSGNGYMLITESVPYEKVIADLDFGIPGCINSFVLNEEKGGTNVTWTVDIPKLGYPAGRYIGAIIPGTMNDVFKQGLDKLKEVTEAMPDPPALEIVEMPSKMVISVIDSCNWQDIGTKMGIMYGELMGAQAKAKAQQTGAPFTRYMKWDEANQFAVFENSLPVDREVKASGRIYYQVLPAGRAVLGKHFGAYDKTMYMYVALDEYVKDFKLEEAGGPIEEYVTDPMSEPDTAKWQTNIYFPVK
jgi:effector-binding domain-containing protein